MSSEENADPTRNLVCVGEHFAQAYLHSGNEDFDHWFIFDDLWGAAHPALANSMLRYATRWDPL